MAPPLSRKDKTGCVYDRPSDIEQAIGEALALDEAAIVAWAQKPKGADGALPTEALVHLVR